MSRPHIEIILGSTREGRIGETVARWFTSVSADRDDMTAELLDLREWDLPFVDTPVPPAMRPPTDPLVRDWADKVAEADGYVLITPEYNHGYPAVLKNALDHVFHPWNRKPVAFVGYGGPAGGVRAIEQLRQVVVELEMVPLRQQVMINRAYVAFDDEGRPREAWHAGDATRVLDELTWWARALAAARADRGAVAAEEAA